MTISTYYNVNRRMILRVFHSGYYTDGAQVISFDDDQRGLRPSELDVHGLNLLLQYWHDFGERIVWCASPKTMYSLSRI